MKYISYHNNKYVIDRRCKTGRVTLSCDTEDDARNIRDIFIKNNWVLDLSKPKIFFSGGLYYVLYKPENKIMILYRSSSKSDVECFVDGFVDTSNISKKRGSYNVHKSIHNRNVSFGFYKSLDEAIMFRDKFRSIGWDYSRFNEIYKKSTIMRNKYIHCTPDGKFKVIKSMDSGNNRVYGTFKDKRKAMEYRDWLVEHDWNVSSDKHITRLFGVYWIFSLTRSGGVYNRRYYKYSDNPEELYSARDSFVSDGFPETCLFETTVLHNISVNGKYYFIEKDNQYYYSSTDLLKTIDVRCILEECNWTYLEDFYKINGCTYEFGYNNRGEKKVDLIKNVDYDDYIMKCADGYHVRYGLFDRCYEDYDTCKYIVDYMLRFMWNNKLCDILEELYVL